MRDLASLPRGKPPSRIMRLRRHAAAGTAWLLWAGAPLPGWLAARGGQDWELVSLLALAVAFAASAAARTGPVCGARVVLALALVSGVGLSVGSLSAGGFAVAVGGSIVAPATLLAADMAMLVLVGALFDRRALAAALGLLLVLAAMPLLAAATTQAAVMGHAAALFAAATTIGVLQAWLWREAARREAFAFLPPPALPSAGRRPGAQRHASAQPRSQRPIWAGAPAPFVPPVVVQVERGATGSLRLAVATSAGPGRTTRIRVAGA